MRKGIQLKVSMFLGIVLLAAFGLTTLASTFQATRLLNDAAEMSAESLYESAVDQARNVFISLEIGTADSLERGEM